MLTNPPVPYDLCVSILIPSWGLLRDCKTSRNLRKPSFEALVLMLNTSLFNFIQPMQVLQLPLREAFSNLTSRDPKKVSFPEGVTKHVTKAAFQNLYLIEYSHLDWDSMWNTWPCVSVTYGISFRLYANDFQIWICQTASSAEYKFTSWLPQVSGLQFYSCDRTRWYSVCLVLDKWSVDDRKTWWKWCGWSYRHHCHSGAWQLL